MPRSRKTKMGHGNGSFLQLAPQHRKPGYLAITHKPSEAKRGCLG